MRPKLSPRTTLSGTLNTAFTVPVVATVNPTMPGCAKLPTSIFRLSTTASRGARSAVSAKGISCPASCWRALSTFATAASSWARALAIFASADSTPARAASVLAWPLSSAAFEAS